MAATGKKRPHIIGDGAGSWCRCRRTGGSRSRRRCCSWPNGVDVVIIVSSVDADRSLNEISTKTSTARSSRKNMRRNGLLPSLAKVEGITPSVDIGALLVALCRKAAVGTSPRAPRSAAGQETARDRSGGGNETFDAVAARRRRWPGYHAPSPEHHGGWSAAVSLSDRITDDEPLVEEDYAVQIFTGG